MEIGIDILDIDRMYNIIDKKTLMNRIFTETEIRQIAGKNKQAKAQTLAGYYSLKEAFLKAIGIGIGRGIALNEISVTYEELGRPYIVLSDDAQRRFNDMGYTKISSSISDTKSVCVATCIVY